MYIFVVFIGHTPDDCNWTRFASFDTYSQALHCLEGYYSQALHWEGWGAQNRHAMIAVVLKEVP